MSKVNQEKLLFNFLLRYLKTYLLKSLKINNKYNDLKNKKHYYCFVLF